MREIKFRAWDKNAKDMFCSPIIDSDDQSLDEIVYFWKRCQDSTGNPGDVTLMEWTGLKDKNGKEIFEGDIVKVDRSLSFKTPAEVWFNEDKAKFDLRNKENDACMFDMNFAMEVIGNIYENKELIPNP